MAGMEFDAATVADVGEPESEVVAREEGVVLREGNDRELYVLVASGGPRTRPW
jgi:hypothetical protein